MRSVDPCRFSPPPTTRARCAPQDVGASTGGQADSRDGDFIADTFDRLWPDNLRNGDTEGMEALGNRLPMMVFARLIGVPAEDVDQLVRWACASTQLLDGLVGEEQLTAFGCAALELGTYIGDHMRRATADPKDNWIGALAIACRAGEFDQLTARLMMIILFRAGGESTGSLLGNSMGVLATRPELEQQLRENPNLLGPFIEETLRYEPPFHGHYRHVVADTTLGGTDLPAGSRLLLLWGAANRDPAHFDAPHEFRLDRPGSKGLITFGKGAHFCVGAALARLEAQIALRAVLDRTCESMRSMWARGCRASSSAAVNVWYWTKSRGDESAAPRIGCRRRI
jgi:cytochrome P450 family 144